jgi:hypothetical protein
VPLTGLAAVLRTVTIPLDDDGLPILPGSMNWDDGTVETITAGTTATHTYAIGTYDPTYTPTGFSSPTYTSPTVTVT